MSFKTTTELIVESIDEILLDVAPWIAIAFVISTIVIGIGILLFW